MYVPPHLAYSKTDLTAESWNPPWLQGLSHVRGELGLSLRAG
jgi:hypothetical protein